MQIDLDHPSTSSGFDILNLATAGANSFSGNQCLTSVNAPCPSLGPSLTANPNPIPVTANAIQGQTTISWSAPDAQLIEIHVGSPTGTLFTHEGNRGSAPTGPWVSDGLTFYLQDVTNGNPLTSDYTLATLVVHLQTSSTSHATLFHFPAGSNWWTAGAAGVLLGFSLVLIRRAPRRRRFQVALGDAALLAVMVFTLPQAKAQLSAKETAANLDRMIAAHKSQRELAQYVFDTHACKSCHSVGENGKLGFNARESKQLGILRVVPACSLI